MKSNIKYCLKILTIFAILFIVYVVLVLIWNKTSQEYKPAGAFDHITRTGPTDISDWTDNRRMND